MTILQVNTTDRGGGAEGSALNLMRGYAARGHDSWMAVGTKQSRAENVVEIPRARIHGLGLPLQVAACLLRRWCGHTATAPALARRLETTADPQRRHARRHGLEDFNFPGTGQLLALTPTPPDLVHCHNLHGWYFDLRELPSLSQRCPVILNLRDAWLLTGHCAYFMECERWRHGCGDCPDLQRYPAVGRDATAANWRRKMDIYAGSRFFVTAPSEWLVSCARSSGLKAMDYRVIPNGIDLSVYRPGDRQGARQRLGLPADRRIVLFAAASSRNVYKDPDTMTATVRELAALPQGRNALFVCLGRARPKGLAGLPIIHIPFQREARVVADYYRSADVFVHTARAEAFGKTATEAMACGTPVVASDTGGLPEQVLDGETGFLAPVGDARAMAAQTERVLGDPDLCSRIGTAAAAQGARFGLERQISAFLAWYAEILSAENTTKA